MDSFGDANEDSGTGVDSETGTMPEPDPDTETDGGSTDGGMDPDSTTGEQPPPPDPFFELSLSQVKQFDFHWSYQEGTQFHQLLERLDPNEPFAQVGDDLLGVHTSLTVPLHFRQHASYQLRTCYEGGCTDSAPIDVTGSLVAAIGYFKASNAEPDDFLGYDVALSNDGTTMVVGAPHEDGAVPGVDGDQSDNLAPNAGAVYVFVRDGQNQWVQQAYIKASNPDAGDDFGTSVSLSADGNTLAVGARLEDSMATGVFHKDELVSGTQGDNTYSDAGAAYVFVRDDAGAWQQQAYIKASNAGQGDQFGINVALSGDGSTLSVGSIYEDSSAAGMGGDQANDSTTDSGAAYVFVRSSQGKWSQQMYVKASNPGESDYFGARLAISYHGDTLAVGAMFENSNATGIDGDQFDESANNAGAVYVMVRDKQNTWTQQAYIKPLNTDAGDFFSGTVALSGDGNTLAVGAAYEDSSATGIGGNPADNSVSDAGAVHVFVRDGQNQWMQQAYVKPSNTQADDKFGFGLALSDDGTTMVVGSIEEDGGASGLGGEQGDESMDAAGAAYVFVRDAQDSWSQHAYVKAPNPDASDRFGFRMALSAAGDTLAITSYLEASDATGVSGDQTSDAAPSAGAVYLY